MRTTTLTEAHGRAMRPRRSFRILAAAMCALAFVSGSASAQSLQWDANGTGAAVTDGSGTWSTAPGNLTWWDGSTNVPWNNAASNIAVFGNGGVLGTTTGSATVTVSDTVNAAGLQFNAVDLTGTNRAYVLAGGTIALADNAFIRFANGSSDTTTPTRLTIGSVLSGNNITLAKTGSDAAFTTISGANTWTGTLTMAATSGGLFANFSDIASLNTLSNIDVQSGNTLVIGYTQTTAMNVPFSLAGNGTGTRGAIRFDQSRTLSGPVTLTANAGVSSNNAGVTATIAGNIGETAGTSRTLTLNTASTSVGTIVLSGDNTFTGGVVLTAGTLRVGSTGALNASTPNLLSFSSNTVAKTVNLNGFSVAVGGLNTLGATDVVTVQNTSVTPATLTIRNTGTQTFRGVLANGTGGGALSLIKSGTGTQVLTRASTYTGSTTVSGGTLQLDFNASGAPASSILSSSTALVMGGGTLALTGSSAAANSQTVNGLVVGAGSSTISLVANGTTAQPLVLNVGAITQQNGGLVNFVLPAGTQSATNGVRTTSTNDASGILGGWATVGGNDWASVSGGNIVAYAGYQTVTNFSTGAGATGPVPNSATANVKIVDGGESGSIALANAAGVTDINTLVQAAAGPAVIGSGATATLRLGVSGGILLTSGAGDLTIGAAANNGSVLTAGGAATGTPGQLIITDQTAGQTTTVNSAIKNNGTGGTVSVVKNGPGTLVLAGTASDYSGGTFINGGIVRITNDSSLGAVPASAQAGNLTFNGGTLQWGAAVTLNSNRGITLLAGGGTLDMQSQGSSVYGGSITGVGSLTKLGTNTLTLTGASDYQGETMINGGILAISNNLALGSGVGGTTVVSGSMLRLENGVTVTGETVTINGTGGNNNGALQVPTGASATWNGNVVIGTALARVGGQNNSLLTINGVIQNGSSTANSLAVSTAGNGGVVLLSGLNTYTGNTQIIRGTLRIGVNNSLPTTTALTIYSASTVTETTQFDLNGFDQTVAGLNSVVAGGSNDVVSVTNSSSATTSTFTVNQAGASTFNGKITGNLALVKDGAGTLNLTNTFNTTTPAASVSNYTGKTTIRAGTLALAGTGNLTGTPWIQVDQGATFSVGGRADGSYALTSQVLSGRGAVTGQLNVGGSSYVSPGNTTGSLLANAGNGLGELTFDDLILAGGTPSLRALFQLGSTSSNLADILSGGSPAYFADASSGGLYDSLQVNGTLGLNAGSTLRVELAAGYTPQLGDVFNLLDWGAINLDADGVNGAGAFTLADLDLSAANAALGNGWYFETNQFLQHGLIYVAAVPEPSRVLFLVFGLAALGMRRRRAI